MAKVQYPPQGGEKPLCLSLFCTMLLSVISAVGVIYSIVIVYVPAKAVLESNLQGPIMCTTLSKQENLTGMEVCDDWTSCEEWCLSLAGERRICLTLFCSMMVSVMSAVAIIYAIVIVYVPAVRVIQSNFQGPKMCSTLSKQVNLSGMEVCDGWTSCVEWCLSKSGKECSHVKASVRELGTEIYWESCAISVDHHCNTLEDLQSMNCKLFESESREFGRKQDCMKFDQIQISCESGICWNVSSVYRCSFKSRLDDIEDAHHGQGYCNCKACSSSSDSYSGSCPDLTLQCNQMRHQYPNKTMEKICSNTECANCKAICSQRQECFDLSTRKDPTVIGTDEYKNPVLRYFTCDHGYCVEIYDLTCERRCDEMVFSTSSTNTIIFNGERIIMAQCSARSTPTASRLQRANSNEDTLVVACTNVTISPDNSSIITRDCVNGTWLPNNFNSGHTNYSHLILSYEMRRDQARFREPEVSYEPDIIIYNETKLKVNIQGCVNTLQEECKAFYHDYGKDGRNYTWRASYPCYFDPLNSDYVVINFNPDKTLMQLIIFGTVPSGIMVLSCLYMCVCSKFIHVADDGHMRLRCCGKYVTGIGNVPRWDPPRRRAPLIPVHHPEEPHHHDQ